MTAGYATFAVENDRYLYDTATSALVGITPAVSDLLDPFLRLGSRAALRELAGRWPARELRDAMAFLRACQGRGMLRPMRRLDYLSVTRAANLRKPYAQGLQRMTLGITERCNQRCRYCSFGGARRPGRASMTWEVARRSIDHLLSRASGRGARTLELFGGEPALDWPLVEEVIRYVRQARRRPNVELVLYTNATLLDRPKLDLLTANEVVLRVSLDGPAHVHDEARRLAGGGPTHGHVIRVLSGIRRRSPAYYRRCVRVHCTFGLESDLLEVFRYFSRPAFRDLEVTLGYRSGDLHVAEKDRVRHEAQLDVLDDWHLQALRGRRPLFHRGLYSSILGAALGGVMIRRVGPIGKTPQPNGACLPGQTRCFVSANGSFHPCENLCQPGSEIGDSSGGIDVAKARALLRSHALVCNRMCQGCWASRLCGHCFLHSIDAGGRPSQARKEVACQLEKEQILRSLRRWVRVWRSEPGWAARVKGSLRWAAAHPDD